MAKKTLSIAGGNTQEPQSNVTLDELKEKLDHALKIYQAWVALQELDSRDLENLMITCEQLTQQVEYSKEGLGEGHAEMFTQLALRNINQLEQICMSNIQVHDAKMYRAMTSQNQPE